MLKARMGGTNACRLKRLAARRMVPSPPSVTTRSVFSGIRWLLAGAAGPSGLDDVGEEDVVVVVVVV